jgi:ankyrin repeat protein
MYLVPGSQDQNGMMHKYVTLLMGAVWYRHKKTVEYIISSLTPTPDHLINCISLQDSRGYTALHWSADRSGEICSLLVKTIEPLYQHQASEPGITYIHVPY